MKANELSSRDLMVGDWVRLINTIHNVSFPDNGVIQDEGYTTTRTPIKITTVSENCVSYYSNKLEIYITISSEEIEPIPLTPEILEKNGFKVEFYNDYKVYELNNFKVCKNCCDYFEVCDLWDDSDWGWRIINFCPCIYVHELQHALKLCEIDKEIVV
jgi:hypothetical protein